MNFCAFFLIAKPSGMLDMVSKGAAYGMPSLQARKRRNMVREMSDQLLDGPDKVKNIILKKRFIKEKFATTKNFTKFKVIDEEESDEASEDGEKYYLYPASANSGPSSAASARQQQPQVNNTNQDLVVNNFVVEENNVATVVTDHDDDEDDNDEYHIISYQEEAEDEVNGY